MKYRDNFFHKTLRYCWDYTESYLTSWPKKIFFLFCIIASELLIAYIIACFDVGIAALDISLKGMWRQYLQPGKTYPWGIFLVFTLCILLFAVLIIWKNGTPPGGRNFKLSKSNVYGSGRELNLKELKEIANLTHKNATTDIILGQLDDTGSKVVSSKPSATSALTNDNSLIFAPSGCGKTTSYVLPYLMQAKLRRHSVIAADTKGELYAKTADSFRQAGFRVLRLDLKDPTHSDGWHVLKELRKDDVRALIFAQTVMANTGNPKDQFAAPQESLLKACCLYCERHPMLPDEQRTFYHALAMLGKGAEELDKTITSACANFPEEMQIVSDAYSTFLHGSGPLRGNIITGLSNRLHILSSPPIRAMTSTDEIDFTILGDEPTVLYVAMSDQHQAMSFLASLAFSFAFQDLVEYADSLPGQRLKIPVCFLMEEFYALGKLPNIGNILSTGRSRGISVSIVVQSLSQLIEKYEDNLTNTILANCATWTLLGCGDPPTSELWEWRSGEATVAVKTVQHDALEPSFRLSHKHSSGDGSRSFYNSNDIIKVKPKKEVLIAFGSYDILRARAFPIFMHQEFIAKRMPEISPTAIIPLSNKKAKEIFRQWEENRIESFNTWMENGGDPLKDYNIPGHVRPTGKCRGKDMPDVIGMHTLERMALAKAAGKKYDPKSDPDQPVYNPRYDPQSKKYNAKLAEEEQKKLPDIEDPYPMCKREKVPEDIELQEDEEEFGELNWLDADITQEEQPAQQSANSEQEPSQEEPAVPPAEKSQTPAQQPVTEQAQKDGPVTEAPAQEVSPATTEEKQIPAQQSEAIPAAEEVKATPDPAPERTGNQQAPQTAAQQPPAENYASYSSYVQSRASTSLKDAFKNPNASNKRTNRQLKEQNKDELPKTEFEQKHQKMPPRTDSE